MKPKKQYPNWYLALTLYLSSIVVAGAILVVTESPLKLLLGESSGILSSMIKWLILLVGLCVGAIFTSKYISQKYILNNAGKIAKLAVIYFIIIDGIHFIYSIAKKFSFSELIYIVPFAISAVVFYLLSKRYLQNTEVVEKQTNP